MCAGHTVGVKTLLLPTTALPKARVPKTNEVSAGVNELSASTLLVPGSVLITLIFVAVVLVTLTLQIKRRRSIAPERTDHERASMIRQPERRIVLPSFDQFTPSPVGRLPHAEFWMRNILNGGETV